MLLICDFFLVCFFVVVVGVEEGEGFGVFDSVVLV